MNGIIIIGFILGLNLLWYGGDNSNKIIFSIGTLILILMPFLYVFF